MQRQRRIKLARSPEEKDQLEKDLADWDNREEIPALQGEGIGDYLERLEQARRRVIDLQPEAPHDPGKVWGRVEGEGLSPAATRCHAHMQLSCLIQLRCYL